MGIYTVPAIFLALYLLLTPTVSFILKRIDKSREVKHLEQSKSLPAAKRKPYEPIRGKWKKHLKFTKQDKRHVAFKLPTIPPWLKNLLANGEEKPEAGEEVQEETNGTFELPRVSRRGVIFVIWLTGAALAFVAPLLKNYLLELVALGVWALYMAVALLSARWMLKERAKVDRKLIVTCSNYLKIPKEEAPGSYVVDEWDSETGIEPVHITFTLSEDHPHTGNLHETALDYMNAVLTNVRTYVEDNTGEGRGFDLPNHTFKVRAKPPMPTIATFNPHYIFAEGVEPGAFAIGLGNEGGMEVPVEEGSDKTVVVIYVNVSGEAEKYAEKHGKVMVAPPTPMVLIMGPTGSGKAQDITEPIRRRRFYTRYNGEEYAVKGIPYDENHPKDFESLRV